MYERITRDGTTGSHLKPTSTPPCSYKPEAALSESGVRVETLSCQPRAFA